MSGILPLQVLPDDEIADLNAALSRCDEFNDWFRDSVVCDEGGLPLLCYHGTDREFEHFDPSVSRGGMHFGTLLQANNRLFGVDLDNPARRSGARVIPVYLRIGNPKRMKEQDAWGECQLNGIRDRGFDGVTYLNRREGLPFERFKELRENGWMTGFGWPRIQKLSDARFLDLVPEACDSHIVFDTDQILTAEKAWAMVGLTTAFTR